MSANPYYSPDELGLTTVGEVELSEPCYDFDLFVVWQDKATGDFLWGGDSGCSCPSPFEDTDLADLTRGNAHAAAAAIQAATEGNEYAQPAAVDVIARVMGASASNRSASSEEDSSTSTSTPSALREKTK